MSSTNVRWQPLLDDLRDFGRMRQHHDVARRQYRGLALICFAMLLSCSGSIIRSLLDTTYQAGLARQALRRFGFENRSGGLRFHSDQVSFLSRRQILAKSSSMPFLREE